MRIKYHFPVATLIVDVVYFTCNDFHLSKIKEICDFFDI